jgi:hypothetical protein
VSTYGGPNPAGGSVAPPGPSSLIALRRAVRLRLGVPVTDDFFTDDILNDVINLAINQIEEQQMWPWTEAIDYPSTDPSLPGVLIVPTDWRATRGLTVADPWNYEVDAVSPADLARFPTTYTGPPSVFAEIGAGIQYRPNPDQAYGLIHHYYRQTPTLVFDADTPYLPGRFAGAVVATAALLLAEREGNRQKAQLYQADVTNWVNLMHRAVRRVSGPTVPRVRPGSWIDR